MCDEDISSIAMLSIVHDHDYEMNAAVLSIAEDHNYCKLEFNNSIEEENSETIDDNIETCLLSDQSFGVLHYEVNFLECFFGKRVIFIEKKIKFFRDLFKSIKLAMV